MPTLQHLIGDYFGISVPEGTIQVSIDDITGHLRPLIGSKSAGYMCPFIKLPFGNDYSFCFLSSTITEEDAKGVVEYAPDISMYANYNSRPEMWEFDTALESFHSLLTSKQLTGNIAVLIKK